MKPDEFDYIKSYYKVNPSRKMRVTVYGKPATITGADGHYLKIRFDDGHRGVCHPIDGVNYAPVEDERHG